jgi:GT2 family glycosyltransferase
MIAYNNEREAITRLQRDLLPALKSFDAAEVIVIDNSAATSQELADALITAEVDGITTRYSWQLGRNLWYGPAMNLAVRTATRPYVLYVCTNHGRSIDPTWACDLLAPLADETVGMTGCLQDAGPPEQYGFPAGLPHLHVQGGVFAARRDVLLRYPYPDGQYAHWGADLCECFQLMRAGLRLVDVPTVKSVWRKRAENGDWKYIHDDGQWAGEQP